MFSISLPIHLKENTNKYDVLDALKRADAEYAFIAFDNIILSAEREKYEKTFSVIGDIIPFLKKHGYKVGIWFWSLWLADIDENELDDVVMVALRVREERQKRHSTVTKGVFPDICALPRLKYRSCLIL